MYGKAFYFSKSIRMKRIVLKKFLNIIPTVFSDLRLLVWALNQAVVPN